GAGNGEGGRVDVGSQVVVDSPRLLAGDVDRDQNERFVSVCGGQALRRRRRGHVVRRVQVDDPRVTLDRLQGRCDRVLVLGVADRQGVALEDEIESRGRSRLGGTATEV